MPLAVTVADRYGNPVVGATVEFTAPGRGATGHTPGGYIVVATVDRSTARASFALVNTPR